jgi:hypothetical protein
MKTITITIQTAKPRIRFAPATIRFVDKKKKQKKESCRNKN